VDIAICIILQVKTTQPRRYLVRPNQGILSPGGKVDVTILLVDKDQQLLLKKYDELGFSQKAMDDATKDKFLVQSCPLIPAYRHLEAMPSGGSSKEEAERLTAMWNEVSSTKAVPIVNKKLLVRHMVVEDENAKATTSGNSPNLNYLPTDAPNYSTMTPENLIAEISSLRKKYDDLVTFSVSLTAERDLLNNSLEQTRREHEKLRKERQSSNKMKKSEKSGLGYPLVFVIAMVMFMLGKYLNGNGEGVSEL